ncbi:hypothetical protein PZT57_26500 [Pseudomonas aeruginosa]|nr:hypothetical protein [Pseudomonas aeruginosa]MEA8592200.1 hypothetical protein [Pseudomonas aeruginosa]
MLAQFAAWLVNYYFSGSGLPAARTSGRANAGDLPSLCHLKGADARCGEKAAHEVKAVELSQHGDQELERPAPLFQFLDSGYADPHQARYFILSDTLAQAPLPQCLAQLQGNRVIG